MNDYEHRTGFVALLIVALVMIAVGIWAPRAEAAGVAIPAHLQPWPRPGFVRTDWAVDLGRSNRTVTTRAWIYRVDCGTGAFLKVLSPLAKTVTFHGRIQATSNSYQVHPGDCLRAAGNATVGGPLISSLSGTYRW